MNGNLGWVAVGTLAALATGTLVRLRLLRGAAREQAAAHLQSLKTWWIVAIAVLGCAELGITAATLLFAAVSVLAFREFVRLSCGPAAERGFAVAGYTLILLNYLWVWLAWERLFVVFLPLASLLVFSFGAVLAGRTDDFVKTAAGGVWGILLTTYSISYAVLLFHVGESTNPTAGGAGWFLFLMLLTEGNDIAQALVGRKFGTRRMTPRVSPGKTWEGFIGGLLGTAVLAVALAPLLTALVIWEAGVAGLLIAIAGLLGDLNESGLKRAAGVKDSGTLLPGQGGMLDRIDSLTFAAPVFYYFVVLRFGG